MNEDSDKSTIVKILLKRIMKGFAYSSQVGLIRARLLAELNVYDWNVLKGIIENAPTKNLSDGTVLRVIKCSFKDILEETGDIGNFKVLKSIVFISGGAFCVNLDNHVLQYLEPGKKEHLMFIDTDNKSESDLLYKFVTEHEISHILCQDHNLGIFASIKPEVKADLRAFKEIGYITDDAVDLDGICNVYNELLKWTVENNSSYLKIMKREFLADHNFNEIGQKILSQNDERTKADIVACLQVLFAKRANKLPFEGNNKVKFIWKDGKMVHIKDNKVVKTVVAVSAAIAVAGTVAGIVVAKNKGKN